MPVYSVPLTDEQILQKTSSKKSYLIIGCSACANVSCNIHRNQKEPVFNLFSGSISIKKEMEKIQKLLIKNDNKANFMTVMGLCSYSNLKGKKIIKNTKGYDTVIVMSCTAGVKTVSNILKDKRIIHGMKVKGFKSVQTKIKGFNLYINVIGD